MTIDPQAMLYNQIDLREAIEWPNEAHVRASIEDWVSKNYQDQADFDGVVDLIACEFNVSFDVRRINDLVGRSLLSHRVLDLTSVAMFLGFPHKSVELIDRFGDPQLGLSHDALVDAQQAQEVLNNWIGRPLAPTSTFEDTAS